MITNVFWDFDGTLFDSYGQISAAIFQAVSDLGSFVEMEKANDLAKVSVLHAMRELSQSLELPFEKLVGRYNARFTETENVPVPLFPGAKEVCSAAINAGGWNHLVTHRGKSSYHHLQIAGLLDCFQGIATREAGYKPKPDPGAILGLIAKYAIPIDSAIMVGDRAIDILAGKNAGIKSFFFSPEGFAPPPEADFSGKSLMDLLALIG
ncbi:MAG: HAD hydrolase-like protein [Clostridiales bacterium]|jgi:phosphoglycolate phosphatase-like HAD superfamily hydrolase|nr:HAD hydrolase-like protein [Clostridiales bacterium]MDR2749440.1 HAD hydrolase-like protein [Clostridiales bacterium]